MIDHESTNVEAAAYLARMEADEGRERPDPYDYDYDRPPLRHMRGFDQEADDDA